MSRVNGASCLRELLSRPGMILSLGAHDVFTALIIQQMGFKTVFVGGFGTSASLLGLPDLNFLTMNEMSEVVGRMTRRLSIPVIADGDTGHGDLHNVKRTVESFESVGAAGIIIEDQVTPKRCGHFQQKEVISTSEMESKITAALSARLDSNFVIIARTDARQMNGFEDALDRVNRYCEAGADVAFIEAPESVQELEEIPRRVNHPLLINVLTGGVTPILTVQKLEQLNYKIAVCPIESLMVTGGVVKKLCEVLVSEGRVDRLASDGMTFSELKELLGLNKYLSLSDSLKQRSIPEKNY